MDSQEGDANTPSRMLSSGRPVASHDMTVGGLMKVLADFMAERGSRDLDRLTACPVPGMT